jgi:hypothetical protein
MLSRALRRFGLPIFLALGIAAFATWRMTSSPSLPQPVLQVDADFSRDIRPILAARCFACHGPDERNRQAGLRLDTKEGLLGGAETSGVVTPGKPEESELFQRITAHAPERRMPPADFAKPLSDSDCAVVRRWIEQGARWKAHWAFAPISRPKPPQLPVQPALKNEVDHFIVQALAEHGLKSSPAADPVTLVRRLSLDLTGLPPSIEEVDAFVANPDDAAYERVVDGLLASPHFGERMAIWWLDLVRYADSVGYQGDQPICVFPYRDYVIRSFNENKRFDQFTREQLAGDLLPEGTTEQKIASGYNRLGMMTCEEGALKKEYLARYAADRVRNLGGTWLGVTLGCCECHDHKFDPFTSRDFYSLEAFFADIDERGVYLDADKDGDWGPRIEFATPAQKAERARLERKLAAARAALTASNDKKAASAKSCEKEDCGAPPKEIREILTLAPEMRTDGQRDLLAKHIESSCASQPTRKRIAELQRALADLRAGIPSTLVTVAAPPRQIRLLPHGNWKDDTGPLMAPAFPEALTHSRPYEGRLTRVDLARWLLARDNPLTARVLANRLWKLYFGAGLARTLDDHGTRGDAPSHPELLDWLAGQLVDSGWNLKYVVKLIVMSGTYRQSSQSSDSLRERDPDNRWLARQNRFRLDAEMVRDNALSISGLLAETLCGPSVRPLQPEGYWSYLVFPVREWRASAAEGRYRRSIYTHWQRQYLHPALLAFDAPTREECTASRPRSNTPLQALVLLNDPEFVEAAVVFAQRTLQQRGIRTEERLEWAFRRALSRPPRVAERAVLTALLDSQLAEYRLRPKAADECLQIAGDAIGAGVDRIELAAWTNVSRAILNLHEAVTRY